MQYDFGICGECQYTMKELVKDHPEGGEPEATARLVIGIAGSDHFLLVIPHRPTCSLHTTQKRAS